MSGVPDAAVASERRARRLFLGLLAVLALGVVVWLWRVYGFSPLRFEEAR
jgi:hypothetical protein